MTIDDTMGFSAFHSCLVTWSSKREPGPEPENHCFGFPSHGPVETADSEIPFIEGQHGGMW